MVAGSIAIVVALVFLILLPLFHAVFKIPKRLHHRINIFAPMIIGTVIGIITMSTVNIRFGCIIVAGGLMAGLVSIKLRDWNL